MHWIQKDLKSKSNVLIFNKIFSYSFSLNFKSSTVISFEHMFSQGYLEIENAIQKIQKIRRLSVYASAAIARRHPQSPNYQPCFNLKHFISLVSPDIFIPFFLKDFLYTFSFHLYKLTICFFLNDCLFIIYKFLPHTSR